MSRKEVIYYTDNEGFSPILDEIGKLNFKEKQKVFAYLSLLEEKGEMLRRPIADYVGDKLYELRPKRHRVLYFFLLKKYAVILHIFLKKTAKLPEADRRIALTRMQDFLNRYERGFIKIGESKS